MDKIKKMGCVLVSLFLLTCIPVFAEDEATQEHEVFINSNALNSTISIETEGTIVSGPGNKVYTNVPVDSTFDVVVDPAEGSELMALTLKQSTEDGAIETIEPIEQQDNVYTFQASGKVTGEAYFGDPVEESVEEAKTAAEISATNKITTEEERKAQVIEMPAEAEKKESVNVEENPVAVEENSAENTSKITADNVASEPILTADNVASVSKDVPVAETSVTPDTGIEEINFAPLFLCMMILAGIVLTVRKKEIEEK
ncbi:MAG: hypothetical protein RR691_02520 [Eubacterium sp.]